MTNTEYIMDLQYLYLALKTHPLLINNEQKKKCFEQLFEGKQDIHYNYNSFVDVATELTSFFNDGHTNIELPYTNRDRCLYIKCDWDEINKNDLIITEQFDNIGIYSKIICIEGKTISNIINLLGTRIPHENKYLVKSRMVKYPYLNYHMFSEMNMIALFGKKRCYEIIFSNDNNTIKKNVPLTFYNGFLDFSNDEDFLSYEIQDTTMVLHLNACIYNEKYIETLNQLAYICKEKKLTSFILDLSKNMGGSSAVIDAFIKFTNVDYFRRYEMIDFSSGEIKSVTNRHVFVKNNKEKIAFPVEIYCRVSHNTFSSARTFAVTLKDNGIAKIIGLPTGGKPNSFGMPQKYKMPISNITFRISRCYFLRPDSTMDNAVTLMPDTVL
ncbi:S41 family peptidase [Anaerocolumna sp. AGMB13020]|uniref:S41 family peptidase n=1 Tax=Anaerocolumna sp. AGMB13020 TaxID=3081750 RepID=UPI00295599C1|nr:S41 family peptidase [Anaerocolumna sp. AGMB13020]WOO35670.1 S41 family peptidase [Anaerocolumna sp. AGMB13020]